MKGTLIKELSFAKKELIDSAQDEQELDSTSDQEKNKVKIDTATQFLHFLHLDMLPTPRDGIREDHAEPVIYKDELQSLTQKTRDKLQALTEIVDSIVRVEEEETQVKEELNRIILEGDKEHGPLAERLVTLDDQYNLIPHKLRTRTNGYKEKRKYNNL